MKRTDGNWCKRWGVVSDTETAWFETYADAEAYLNTIAKPTELKLSSI